MNPHYIFHIPNMLNKILLPIPYLSSYVSLILRLYFYLMYKKHLLSLMSNFLHLVLLLFCLNLWHLHNLDLLLKMYDNLEELVNEGKLKEQIINDCKYESYPPYWLQNPEWPVIDGVVCIFQKQSDFPDYLDYDKDQITYTFLNPKTNEIIEVVQYD